MSVNISLRSCSLRRNGRVRHPISFLQPSSRSAEASSIDEDPGAPTPKLASQHPDDYGIRPTPTLARRGLSQRLRLQSPPGLLPRASSALPAGGPVASRIARCRLTKLLSPQQCKPISGIWTAVRVHRSTVYSKPRSTPSR